MSVHKSGVASFVFVGSQLRDLDRLLERCFTHRWVASYQVGFGPPLVRSSDKLTERLKPARSALDKLRAYLEVCVYDEPERARLAKLHRRQVVRRMGPVEAESLEASSANVLDLSLRLHEPLRAPDEVRADMIESGVDTGSIPRDAAPESMSGRFFVHLRDPRGSRMLHVEAVRAVSDDPERAVALELRVPVPLRSFYASWCRALARDANLVSVDLGEPRPVARVSRDGARR